MGICAQLTPASHLKHGHVHITHIVWKSPMQSFKGYLSSHSPERYLQFCLEPGLGFHSPIRTAVLPRLPGALLKRVCMGVYLCVVCVQCMCVCGVCTACVCLWGVSVWCVYVCGVCVCGLYTCVCAVWCLCVSMGCVCAVCVCLCHPLQHNLGAEPPVPFPEGRHHTVSQRGQWREAGSSPEAQVVFPGD